MINLTPFIRPVTNCRVRQIERYATAAEAMQRGVLKHLVSEASATEWGIRYNYSSIRNYEQFAAAVGVQDYERSMQVVCKVVGHNQRQEQVHPCHP